jgi:L-arginine dehydrogenase
MVYTGPYSLAKPGFAVTARVGVIITWMESPMSDSVRVMDAAEVAGYLERIDALDVMRRLFRSLGSGRAAQPPQTLALFPGGGGDVITYLGVLEDAGVFGAKQSPYITRNGSALITAWTTLMSMETGRPLLLCDSKQLTTERTAATTALAVDLLARGDATRLAIIGTGPIAQAHLRHVRGLRNWNEIRLHSRQLMRTLDMHDALHAMDPRVMLSSTVEQAVRDADVVMLCTSSATPVLDPADLAASTLITSVSTNAPRAHEVPPISLFSMECYCDDRTSTPLSAGEMVMAAEEHGWSPSDLAGDLGDLVLGRIPAPSRETHTYFRSIGLGLEDVAMAKAVLDLARRESAAQF